MTFAPYRQQTDTPRDAVRTPSLANSTALSFRLHRNQDFQRQISTAISGLVAVGVFSRYAGLHRFFLKWDTDQC
jgi:hypothetical protein